MSAYICSPAHVAGLAAFAASGRGEAIIRAWRVNSNPMEGARKVGEELMRANIASVAKRYPYDQDGGRPGPCGYTDAELIQEAGELAERYYFAPQVLTPLDVYRMAVCFAYQACEVEGYRESFAHDQIELIKAEAVGRLPGYEEAIRDYDGDRHAPYIQGPKPVLLSSLLK